MLGFVVPFDVTLARFQYETIYAILVYFYARSDVKGLLSDNHPSCHESVDVVLMTIDYAFLCADL